MILVNTDYISGRELETLSLVKGSTIQSKHIGKDIAQSFKTLVGGELKSYNGIEKTRIFQNNIYFCFTGYAKAFVWITTNCGKVLKRWEYQTTLLAS